MKKYEESVDFFYILEIKISILYLNAKVLIVININEKKIIILIKFG